jgi:hypothetical protein
MNVTAPSEAIRTHAVMELTAASFPNAGIRAANSNAPPLAAAPLKNSRRFDNIGAMWPIQPLQFNEPSGE